MRKNDSDSGRGLFESKGFPNHEENSVLRALISGSISSTLTTVIYQPLELLKTRIQIQDKNSVEWARGRIFGRATKSAINLAKSQGILYLWRGTAASLARSGPGVGLYYASLNVLHTKFSVHDNKPDNPIQAFCFGLTARSLVSFMLLPVTVVKVRYESGKFAYSNFWKTICSAYLANGWVGVGPTILRDSLFSGTYYMCYTKLKTSNLEGGAELDKNKSTHHKNFINGLISGLVASIITNPIDVLKTNIQAADKRESVAQILLQKDGYMRFFDGLVPRSLRRALVAATTWTLYELLIDSGKLF